MVKMVTNHIYIYHEKVKPKAQEAEPKALGRKLECMDSYHPELLVKSPVGLNVGSYLDLVSTWTSGYTAPSPLEIDVALKLCHTSRANVAVVQWVESILKGHEEYLQLQLAALQVQRGGGEPWTATIHHCTGILRLIVPFLTEIQTWMFDHQRNLTAIVMRLSRK